MEHTNLSEREILLLLEQKVDGLGEKIDKFETKFDADVKNYNVLNTKVVVLETKVKELNGFKKWFFGSLIACGFELIMFLLSLKSK